MKLAAAGLFAALASSTQAALQITAPGSNFWWVENSNNVLSWTCQDPAAVSQYTVVVYHPGNLAGGLPIKGLLNNYDCSEAIPPQGDLVAGTNYTVALTNPQNRTDILALSEPFEIKPYGSTYPSTSTTTPASSATGATNSGTSSTPASTSTKSGAAPGPVGASSAVISGIAFVLGAFLA